MDEEDFSLKDIISCQFDENTTFDLIFSDSKIFIIKEFTNRESEYHKRSLADMERTVYDLDHKCIVKGKEFKDRNGMVLEFGIRGSLHYGIKHLTYENLFVIFYGIADALTHIHGKNFMHRDIKPNNIVLDHKNRPILIDFGYARNIEAGDMTFCGTKQFMAPEIKNKEPYSKEADVYSFGLTCLYCLAFVVGNDDVKNSILKFIRNGEAQDIKNIINIKESDVSDVIELWRIVINCININPAERTQLEDVKSEIYKAKEGDSDFLDFVDYLKEREREPCNLISDLIKDEQNGESFMRKIRFQIVSQLIINGFEGVEELSEENYQRADPYSPDEDPLYQ